MIGEGIGVQLLLIILFGFFVILVVDEWSNKKDDE